MIKPSHTYQTDTFQYRKCNISNTLFPRVVSVLLGQVFGILEQISVTHSESQNQSQNKTWSPHISDCHYLVYYLFYCLTHWLTPFNVSRTEQRRLLSGWKWTFSKLLWSDNSYLFLEALVIYVPLWSPQTNLLSLPPTPLGNLRQHDLIVAI